MLVGASVARPEPMESLLTRLGIVVTGISLPLFYQGFRRLFSRIGGANRQVLDVVTVVFAALPFILLFSDFSATNLFSKDGGDAPQNSRDLVTRSNFEFFFNGFLLGDALIFYILLWVPLICWVFFRGFRVKRWDKRPVVVNLINNSGYLLLALSLAAVLGMDSFRFPYTYENSYDFDAVYYSMTQVFAGVPLLVNDFTNTYGMYPFFLAPLFHIIGLSVLKFSTVMAVLAALSFTMNFVVLKRHVSNKLILFLGFFTVLFFPFLDARLATEFDAYFAMYPIRYIIPSLLLFLASIYLQSRSRVVYMITTLLLGFSILWNPEAGLVSAMSWVAMNMYTDFFDEHKAIAWKRMLKHPIVMAAGVMAAFGLFAVTVRTFYGAWPQMSLLFRTMQVFGELGFNLLPMAPVHPWNMMALVLVLGFLYASSSLHKRAVTPKSSMVLLLTLIGLGFFLYFQGRSHNWSFASISGFAIMLLTILGDELWTVAERKSVPALDVLFAGFLLVVSFSVPEIIYAAPSIVRVVFPEEAKRKRAGEQQMVESNRDFIYRNTAEKEKTLILTAAPRQGLYYDGNKRISAFNPPMTEMFFNASLKELERAIANGPDKIFIEPLDCRFLYMVRPLLTLGANYEVAQVNGNMCMAVKKSDLPLMAYMNRADGILFHRKYRDEPGYTDARIRDAVGTEPITLDSAFAVEILFKAGKQLWPTAALLSNLGDSSGLLIEKREGPDRYYFGLFGDGMEGKIQNNGWVYCVLNVNPREMVLYVNGARKGSKLIQNPYRQSAEAVHVGNKNMSSVAFYTGVIGEVAILNRNMDEREIAANFAAMAAAR